MPLAERAYGPDYGDIFLEKSSEHRVPAGPASGCGRPELVFDKVEACPGIGALFEQGIHPLTPRSPAAAEVVPCRPQFVGASLGKDGEQPAGLVEVLEAFLPECPAAQLGDDQLVQGLSLWRRDLDRYARAIERDSVARAIEGELEMPESLNGLADVWE